MTAASVDELVVSRQCQGAVVEVTFNRPHRHNAFTSVMYDGLRDLFSALTDDQDAHVVVFRGAGAVAFAAGNDIAEFATMTEGSQAVAYESRIRALLMDLGRLPQVSVAAIDGLCVGGGLAVATYCDLRLATSSSRFGYPIARTLGNALSRPLLERCVHVFGESMTRQMLLASRLIDAHRAFELGALLAVTDCRTALDREVETLVTGLLQAAPATLRTTKEQLAQITAYAGDVDHDEHLLERVYGGPAFREGVRAFLAKERPDFRQATS
ncbi:1,4-dihydroxy-2-naphthoyl-CoA synthase [Austwickia sp. TVS 96-490-7B]|uniref:enoyl-CoA hydratase-related protein n=1 Tax=Austwickia sp. TVS 96-490-7B TaxID=2830843 RepID=UPI001DC7598A|nr:enoyl-CoA hydratase-related protein [Austwickia sp. TVS 96-490-7B]MBW3085696.1 1,4-dihydroxy-2-naphthoyl-CoA synthase [Austwickia sp. TVS 96-490-7B]